MANAHDASYQASIYITQGTQELHVGSPTPSDGPEGAGAAVVVGANSQVVPYVIAVSNAKGGSSNICLVTFQLQDGLGNSLAQVGNFDVWLSDAATGAGLTATTPSGGVAAGANGAIIGVSTTSKAVRAQTDATGKFILSITDTAKTGFYPCVQTAFHIVTVGAQLTTGSYD